MIASLLIKEEILPLGLDDKVYEAVVRMNEYKVSHFPVTDDGVFIGLISEKNIFSDDNEAKIDSQTLQVEDCYVEKNRYVFDVLKIASNFKLSIIPVVDESNKYIGSITLPDLLDFFTQSMAVDNPGGVVVLEVSENDYSLTEIANIIESNDAKVLSTYIISQKNSTKIKVIVKVSRIDLGAILKTFDRYGYTIVASFQENIDYEDVKENYDSLMNYLKI